MSLNYPVLAKRRSLAVNRVMDLFGLSGQEEPLVIASPFELPLQAGQIALFHGPSGSGKSTLLRHFGGKFSACESATIPLPDAPLIETAGNNVGDTEQALDLLTACGLGEARLLMRTPAELSEGQRQRFRLAYAIYHNECISVDEFAAVLERPLAKILAYNLRRLVTRLQRRVLVATTHEDIAEDLQADWAIHCTGDGEPTICQNGRKGAPKKSVSSLSAGSVRVPVPTGRISLGGITGGIR